MSIEVSTAVWKSALQDTELLVMLALADWADDDGGNIFPSKARIAWKVGASERTVQRVLADFRDRGYVVTLREATRHQPPMYRIMVDRLPKKDPFQARGDNLAPLNSVSPGEPDLPLGEPNEASRGDTAMAPNPSDSIRQRNPLDQPSDSPPPPSGGQGDAFGRFWKIYPRKVGKLQAEKAFRRALKLAPAEELIAAAERDAAGWAATGKDPRYIPHPTTWLNGGRWNDEQEQGQFQGAGAGAAAGGDILQRLLDRYGAPG
jgi:hypothetical protein